ncbi:RHS repeat-associated core domain-containing protein [Providencia rettgeri]|uniref:RHS repeat-associated core domain-containing protein n=1 Tax=Providencia rettgeri TaxID=587 RepID=UPI0023AB3BB7|nr:RHS repeat-associated core domain-containing protein [Providencia rettgeri]
MPKNTITNAIRQNVSTLKIKEEHAHVSVPPDQQSELGSTVHLSTFEMNGKETMLQFVSLPDDKVQINQFDYDTFDYVAVQEVSSTEYDSLLDEMGSQLPRVRDNGTVNANGNTLGVITHVPLSRGKIAEEANPVVVPETETETSFVQKIQSESAKWAMDTQEKLVQTANDLADDPVGGSVGAGKQFYNDIVDTGELLTKGAVLYSAFESVKLAAIGKVFGIDALADYGMERASDAVKTANDIDFRAIKAELNTPAEKAGAAVYDVASLATGVAGLAKGTVKVVAKKTSKIRKTAEPSFEKVSPGGTVKPRADGSANSGSKASDTQSTKVNDDTSKTKTSDEGKGLSNENKTVKGDPVDLVSGDFIQAWSVINIPGLLPIELNRTYYSTQSSCGIFGPKWADNWSMCLEIHDDTADFLDPEGHRYTFSIPNDAIQARNLRAPHYLLLGNTRTGFRIQDNHCQRVYYFDATSPKHHRLTKIVDLRGVALHFHYNEAQQLSHVLRDDGFLVRLHYQHNQLAHIDYEHAQQTRRLVTCQYNTDGFLSECDAFQQNHLWHTYTVTGWMTSWRDTDQTELTIIYDERGRVIQTHSDRGYWCDRFLYDETLQVNTYIDGEGGHFRYYYNDDNLVIRTLDPLGRETRTEWQDFQKVSETNAIGETTRYVYHADGLLAQIHFPDKRKVGYEYNDNGQLTRYVAPTGDEWRLTYDPLNNLSTVIDPQGQVQTYQYSQHGELLKAIQPNGAQWQYEYNQAHQLIKSTNPYQNSTEYQFDELGRLEEYTDALKHTTHYRYSSEHAGVNGSVSDILLPDGVHQHIEYDRERRVVAVTDGAGKTTHYRYGPFDLLLAMVRPDGTEIRFEYDSLTRLKTVINATGDKYTYERDRAGQIIRETDFTGCIQEFRYDRLGRRIATRYPDNHELRWRYDVSGLITEQSEWLDNGIEHKCLSITTYEYNARLQLVKATNPDSVVEFEYDEQGRLTCESINGQEIKHDWDAESQLLLRTGFGEHELHYAFGQLGELTSLQVNQHAPLQYSYNAVGQEYLRRSEAGFVNSSHYTATGLLAHQRAGRGSESFLQSLQHNPHQPPFCTDVHRSYQYDRTHNVVSIEDDRWKQTTYRYNANDQITEAQYSNQIGNRDEKFLYDANLNLTEHMTLPSDAQGAMLQLFQQQQAGRVTRRDTVRGYQLYHYDVNGRLEKKIVYEHGYRPKEWHYLWNTQNQLTACFTPKGDCWRYTYDAFGRRLSKTQTVDSQAANANPLFPQLKPKVMAWHYLWSGDQMVEETPIYADGTIAHGLQVQWLYEPGAITPTARYQNGKLHYVVTDHQGTPREIFTEAGKASWAGRLNTWGQMQFWQSQDGRADNDPNYTECHFRFAGQYEDSESGLYYNRFRYYDRDSGQYISPDPIGLLGGLNPYGYVHNPTGWVDPFGLSGFFTGSTFTGPSDITYTVYQQTIDWDLKVNTRDGVKTNLQIVLEDGRSPMVVKNGKYEIVSLHHSKQNSLGPLFELSTPTHEQYRYSNALHPHLPDAHPINPVDRNLFDADRKAYWRQRAEEEVNRRKLLNCKKGG